MFVPQFNGTINKRSRAPSYFGSVLMNLPDEDPADMPGERGLVRLAPGLVADFGMAGSEPVFTRSED